MKIAGWLLFTSIMFFGTRLFFRSIKIGRNKGKFHGGGVENLENRSPYGS